MLLFFNFYLHDSLEKINKPERFEVFELGVDFFFLLSFYDKLWNYLFMFILLLNL